MQPGMAGQQRAVRPEHGEIDAFGLVEKYRADLARREAQFEFLAGGVYVGGHRIGIVQQRAVEGPLGEIDGHSDGHHHAQQPGQRQRHQHMLQHAGAQRRQAGRRR